MLIKGRMSAVSSWAIRFLTISFRRSSSTICFQTPFGVDWKKIEGEINDEHQQKGFNGRFGQAYRVSLMVRCCF
ncbi:hypothetical protein M5585_29660 [Serratia ureilytica]